MGMFKEWTYHFTRIRSEADKIDFMRTKYELALNPNRYLLSDPAKQRLKWIWQLETDYGNNVSKASKKLKLSRQWLSTLKSIWLKSNRDPRKLEPQNRAPKHTDNRRRISQDTVDKIITLRKKYPVWGKEKIARLMWTRHQIEIGDSTVNRYLAEAKLLNVRISQKNSLAFKNKILKQQIRQRPPKVIKDYKPGALVEKDMKFILKQGVFTNTDRYKEKAKENFFFQHTMNDDFTRIRVLDVVADASSLTAKKSFLKSKSRFPFSIVCLNTDSGGENGKDFAKSLTDQNIIHFFSRTGTPTDNPRVERSHLTDDLEFYSQSNRQHKDLKKLKAAQRQWERTYNFTRPHQALGYLTPMEFYQLWKTDPKAAYKIKDKWQTYLQRQSKRLHTARRMKKKEKIEALMEHIDSILTFNSYH
jgi:transposase InsO family protein